MRVVKAVPNLSVSDVARANDLYSALFGLEVEMDHGWVASLSARGDSPVALQTTTKDASALVNPAVSIGVASVDDLQVVYERVVAAGLEIVHPVTDEPWGVRRFFFRDPDWNVINVVAHP